MAAVWALGARLALLAAFGAGLTALLLTLVPAFSGAADDSRQLWIFAASLALALAIYQAFFKQRW